MKLVHELRTPSHRRSVLIRRVLALALVVAAVFSAASTRAREPEVLVFARDVAAGTVVSSEDVELRRLPASAVPATALGAVADAEGTTLAAGAAAGEVVTHTRLVGPELSRSLAPEGDYTMVPVVLAEPEIVPLLHHGAHVRVITLAPETGAAVTVASGARVVLASTEAAEPSVLLLLRAEEAAAVAASSLAAPLTVVLEAPPP
ncbi:SAF domain-containing protein [Corynebacterium timonense]|uniref:SAF domain-containing protein n=1 Tax=Corynebacterium timonense TaxID=441500 RepID=A0A1H1R3M8_9CORY|nr:SAF domain-containing protein [Corynebacterium timonense]SDS30155.1 SAF domain-containing protein [Corynebacterium timonense]